MTKCNKTNEKKHTPAVVFAVERSGACWLEFRKQINKQKKILTSSFPRRHESCRRNLFPFLSEMS